MPIYHVFGDFTRTLRFTVNEEIEADSEEEAIADVLEDIDESEAWDSDDRIHGITAELVSGAPPEPAPPLLREKDDREALEAWRAGKPIKGKR